VHLNGGTYNLGHRNPELVDVLKRAADHFDMGNHHFPALARTVLAEELAEVCPGDLQYTIFAAAGAEAIDVAIKTARHTMQKRKIVSIIKAYHGHTGLAVCAGDPRFSEIFLSDRPDEFTQVPFNDLNAMEEALRGRDVAAVIMETIPATYGFPMPAEGYLAGVKRRFIWFKRRSSLAYLPNSLNDITANFLSLTGNFLPGAGNLRSLLAGTRRSRPVAHLNIIADHAGTPTTCGY
jgi:acetylornithine/succinyldiaminopimelate/putrescine aminotransferase